MKPIFTILQWTTFFVFKEMYETINCLTKITILATMKSNNSHFFCFLRLWEMYWQRLSWVMKNQNKKMVKAFSKQTSLTQNSFGLWKKTMKFWRKSKILLWSLYLSVKQIMDKSVDPMKNLLIDYYISVKWIVVYCDLSLFQY